MEFLVDELNAEQYDLLKVRPLSFEIVNFIRGLINNADLLWSAVVDEGKA